MLLKTRSVMMIWWGICLLLASCSSPLSPQVQPVMVTSPPHEPAGLATTRQKLAEMHNNPTCHQPDTGCALIEVVGMPGTIPLNRVLIGIHVPMGDVTQTNERGWAYKEMLETGQYTASMSLGWDHTVVYEAQQEVVIQSGEPAFVRFEVPIEQVPDYYLPEDT